jgi:inner membrane protein
MSNNQEVVKKTTNFIKRSVTLKIGSIGILILLLLIPAGMAILIFYTLVFSLSEHMHFNFAYILSALAVTLIISGYAKAIVANPKFAFTIFGLLTILYSYLFIVLQLEDYALIMGSVGLLIILAIVMYMTRKINWYEVETGQQEE